MGNVTPERAPDAPVSNGVDRLDSWKVIAAYLNRSVATVQRWEKTEGLPVQRHHHGRQGSVYASRADVDVWWEGRRTRLESESEPGHQLRRWLWVTALLVPSLLVGHAIRTRWTGRQEATSKRVMLAVLPLQDLGGDEKKLYLSEGLTEELTTELGRLNAQQLGVIARASAAKYQGSHKSIGEIGRELRVDYILSGSARVTGERAHITMQLLRVSDQTQLWAQVYDHPSQDLLAVQEDVAEHTTHALAVRLLPAAEKHRAQARWVNPEARDAYLQGRYRMAQRTMVDIQRANEFFARAVGKDPNFAPAYSGLADSYILLVNYAVLPQREGGLKAKAAASKALELDESLVEARTSVAAIENEFEWNFAAAEKEFQRAIAENPNYSLAHQWYAAHLAEGGRLEECLAQLKIARELDPLSLRISVDIGRALYFGRQYDSAIRQYREVLSLDPNFLAAHSMLGLALLETGHDAEAIQELEKGMPGQPPSASTWIPYAYARAGKRAQAQQFLQQAIARWKQSHMGGAGIALTYVALGDRDRAFLWLEQEYSDHSASVTMLKAWPYWDPLRSDPRFGDLVRRVGLPL